MSEQGTADEAIETAIAMVHTALHRQQGARTDRSTVETLLLELEVAANIPLVAASLAIYGATVAVVAGLAGAGDVDEILERAAAMMRGQS